nr:pyrroline-5-carboxylate reductase [Ipomoea batatas]
MANALPIPSDSYKLGFIGAGKLAESIARGVVKSGLLPPSRIRTAHTGPARRTAFESFGVTVYEHNKQVVEDSDVIIFSVKPQIVTKKLLLANDAVRKEQDICKYAKAVIERQKISMFSSLGRGRWQFKEVASQVKPILTEKQLLVSVAAGVKLKDLQEWAGNSRFIRVMPNTPAAVGEAASESEEENFEFQPLHLMFLHQCTPANCRPNHNPLSLVANNGNLSIGFSSFREGMISLGSGATKEDGDLISLLFGAIGKVWKADEKLFDAVTGLSGSGPAYIYLAIEALADGGVAAGLPRDLALGLASQTVLGAASMATNAGKHPGQLKDDVTSPGGTTIAGVHELEKAGFRGTLMNAVVAATKRSRELSPN